MYSIIFLVFLLSSCGMEQTVPSDAVASTTATPTAEKEEKKDKEFDPDLDEKDQIKVKAPKGNFLIKTSKFKKEKKHHPLSRHFSLNVVENTVDENSEFTIFEDEDQAPKFTFVGLADGKLTMIPIKAIGPAISIKHSVGLRQIINLHLPYDKGYEKVHNTIGDGVFSKRQMAILYRTETTVELISADIGVERKEENTLSIWRDSMGTFQLVYFEGSISPSDLKYDINSPHTPDDYKNTPPPNVSISTNTAPVELAFVTRLDKAGWFKSSCKVKDGYSYQDSFVFHGAIYKYTDAYESLDCTGTFKFRQTRTSQMTALRQDEITLYLKTRDVQVVVYTKDVIYANDITAAPPQPQMLTEPEVETTVEFISDSEIRIRSNNTEFSDSLLRL